jgi:hypothetical protein
VNILFLSQMIFVILPKNKQTTTHFKSEQSKANFVLESKTAFFNINDTTFFKTDDPISIQTMSNYNCMRFYIRFLPISLFDKICCFENVDDDNDDDDDDDCIDD